MTYRPGVSAFLAALLVSFAAVLMSYRAAEPDHVLEIKEFIVEESLLAFHGVCPCPFSWGPDGRRCGNSSAYSRSGEPACYVANITSTQIHEYRKRHGIAEP